MSEKLNRKCTPRNATVPLSTPYTDPELSNFPPHPPNFKIYMSGIAMVSMLTSYVNRTKKNAYVTWCTVCSCMCRSCHFHVLSFICYFCLQNFQSSMIGYLNSSSCVSSSFYTTMFHACADHFGSQGGSTWLNGERTKDLQRYLVQTTAGCTARSLCR